MLRVVIALPLFLLVSAAGITPVALGAAGPGGVVMKGPTFRYSLTSGQDIDVCKHMQSVFNEKFSHLWDGPPLTSLTDDPNYSANGKYSFPLLPGVTYSAKATAELSLSAQPTSPEFSAIRWQEGTAHSGGCPAGSICPGDKPAPVLVAYFDFDNDGYIDTVVKHGIFFSGYNSMFLAQEYVEVWRGRTIKITGNPSLWDLRHEDKNSTSIISSGMYLRPFIYEGVTYVATYEPHFDSDRGQEPGPPPYPIDENMLIEQFQFPDKGQQTDTRQVWDTMLVCDLHMERLE